MAGVAFLGRVGQRTCSDLGHHVEGGKWAAALLASGSVLLFPE